MTLRLALPQALDPGRALWALYLVSFLSGASMGLFTPLASARMQQLGFDGLWIGIVSTAYYLMVALGAPLAAWLLRRLGVRRTVLLGLALNGLTGPLFPLHDSLAFLLITRALAGLGASLYMTSAQAALVGLASDQRRAAVSGLYALAFGVGLGVGPVLGPALYQRDPLLAFGLGGLLPLLGALVLAPALSRMAFVPARAGRAVLPRVGLPLHAVFAYGFAEATLFSLYPVFLMRRGMDLERAGLACTLFVVGSIAATLPVTWLADRLGKPRVLAVAALVGLAATLGVTLTQAPLPVLLLSLLGGASVGPLYAVALALVGDSLPADELASGSALFTAVFSVGCTAGPLLSSAAMQLWGERGLFVVVMLLLALLPLHARLRAPALELGLTARGASR